MHTGKDSARAGPGKALRKIKVVKWILIVTAVFVLLPFVAIPSYLSSEKGRQFILGKINRSIDGTVHVGDFSMGWFKGVRVMDLSFEDNAGATSVNVKEISAKPCYGSLLFGSIALGETLIDDPQVVINLKQGQEATETGVVSKGETAQARTRRGGRLGLAKIDLTVNGGNLTINPASQEQALESLKVSNMVSKVDINPPGAKSTFDVALAVAEGQTAAKVTVKGSLTPAAKKNWTLKGTSGDFTAKVDNLDLEMLGPLFALAGKDIDASGTLNADITARIDDGRFEKLQAKATLSGPFKEVSGKYGTIYEPLRIDAEISSDEEKIRIDRLSLVSSFCRVDCKGGVNSVDYVATADLEGLQKFAGQFADFGDYTVAGIATENGNISFENGTIAVRGQGNIQDFVLADDKQSTPKASVQAGFDLQIDSDRDILKISSLQTAADIGQVKIADSVVPLGQETKQELALDIEADVDLQKAQPFVDFFVSLPEELDIGGRLVSDVSVSKKKGKFNVVTDATSVKNFRLAQAGREPFEEKEVKLALDMTCDPAEKAITINKLRVDSAQIKITKGTFTKSSKKGRTKLVGEVEAEYDLAAVSKAASAFIPEGFEMQGKRTTKVEIESEYPHGQAGALLANLNTEAKFGFDKATYKGLNFGTTQMELKVTEGMLTIEPFSAPVNNGKVNLAAKVNFKEKPILLETPGPMQIIEKVNINDETSRQMLMYLNPIFADAVNVRGVADFHCEKLTIPLAGATRDDVVVVGTVGIDRMRLDASDLLGQIVSVTGGRGVDMTMLPTRFVLQKGSLRYDDMQINIGDNPVNFAGVIGLNKRLNMNVTLPYRFGGTTVTSGESAADRITLPIEGTLDKPKINVQKLLETEALKQGLKLLEKVLK